MVLIRWGVFFLLWAGMMVFHLVTYFGSQYLEGEPHTVGGSLDERIPFHPGWIYIYSSWFVLLLGVPALLNIVAPELCLKYMLAHSIDQLLSNIIYLIYPTTFERPVPPKKGLTGFVIGTVYGANHRFLNCAPSVHCSVSFLFAFAALAAPMLPLWLRLVIVAWVACDRRIDDARQAAHGHRRRDRAAGRRGLLVARRAGELLFSCRKVFLNKIVRRVPMECGGYFSFFLYFRARRSASATVCTVSRVRYGCIGRLSTVAHSSSVTGQGMYCFKPSNACWVCIGFG